MTKTKQAKKLRRSKKLRRLQNIGKHPSNPRIIQEEKPKLKPITTDVPV